MLLFFTVLFYQFVDIPVRKVRKFFVKSFQYWIEKKVS